MATSGQIQTNTAFGYVRLAWSLTSQSVPNNTSTIQYTLSIYRSSSISSTAAKAYSISINGSNVATGTTTIGGSGTKTIKTGTTTISHNSDGTKVFSFGFSQQIDITWSGSWIGTVTGSGSGTLTTIPRATTPVLSASSVEMGSPLTVTLNRASSSFTHKLTYSFGTASDTIASNVGTSATWTVPLAIAAQIPNATSGTGTITCQTYNGEALIGTKSVSFVATVPSTVIPTITSVTISEGVTTPDIASQFGEFVQGHSKASVLAKASGAYSSSIVTCKLTIRNGMAEGNPILATYYADSVTNIGTSGVTILSEALSFPTTSLSIGVSVTDSRGRVASVSYNRDLLTYSPPKINGFSAFRCDSEGGANYEGTRLNVSVNFAISPVNDGTSDKNTRYYEILYKVKGAASWGGTLASGNIFSRNDSFVSDSLFSGDNAYELWIRTWDFFTTAANGVYATIEIPTAFTVIDFRSTGKGVAFGKVSEADCMEIALDVDLTGELLQEERQTPTLLNGWVNHNTGYEGAIYWKDKCDVVHLAGLIKSGTTTAETVIFTLPAGYRPRNSEKFFCVSLNAICVIDVYSTGDVAIKTGANAGWLSLSGVSFRAA